MSQELTLDAIEQKLAYVGAASTRIASAAMLSGAKVFAVAQQSAALTAVTGGKDGKVKSTGNMRLSIRARNFRVSGSMAAAKSGFDVGRRKKNAEQPKGNHGHLFVGGTDHRYTGFVRVRRRGKLVDMTRNKNKIGYRGVMPAHRPSFIKTAATAAQGNASAAVHASLESGIARAIDKQGG